MGQKRIITNNLSAGEVSKALSLHPESPAYQNGCETIDGFDVDVGGLVPALAPASFVTDSTKATVVDLPVYAVPTAGSAKGYFRNTPFSVSTDGTCKQSLATVAAVPTLEIKSGAAPVDLIASFSEKIANSKAAMVSQSVNSLGGDNLYTAGTTYYVSRPITLLKAKFLPDNTDRFALGFAHAIPPAANSRYLAVTNTPMSGWAFYSKFNIPKVSEQTVILGISDTDEVTIGSQDCYSVGIAPNTAAEDKTFPILLGTVTLRSSYSMSYNKITLPKGYYTFTANTYLVGAPETAASAVSSVQYDVKNNGDTNQLNWQRVDEKMGVAVESDVFVLGLATDITDFSSRNTADQFLQSNYGGMFTAVVPTDLVNVFSFTGHTTILGGRRFGPAAFSGVPGLFGATRYGEMAGIRGSGAAANYNGVSVGVVGDTAGDATATILAGAWPAFTATVYGQKGSDLSQNSATLKTTDAYLLAVDSQPYWFESVYSGIIVGTKTAEYLVRDYNDATRVSVQKISSIGSPTSGGIATKTSCVLGGDVYFASNRGLSTIKFSNETQSYLPQHVPFFGTRLEGFVIDSIAPNAQDSSIYFTAVKGAERVVRKASIISGTITNPDYLSGLTSSDLQLLGVTTVSGVASLYVQNTSGTKYSLPIDGGYTRSSSLRTTKFGAVLGSKSTLTRVFFTGANIRKLRYKLSSESTYQEVPLTPDELESGFSGTKEILFSGTYLEPSNGIAIDVIIDSGPDQNSTATSLRPELVSIAVEVET